MGTSRRDWLGLFSDRDEAIAGTQASVGFYANKVFRLPWPGSPPIPWPTVLDAVLWPFLLAGWSLSWVVVPVINGVLMPLAEWIISLVFRASSGRRPCHDNARLDQPRAVGTRKRPWTSP